MCFDRGNQLSYMQKWPSTETSDNLRSLTIIIPINLDSDKSAHLHRLVNLFSYRITWGLLMPSTYIALTMIGRCLTVWQPWWPRSSGDRLKFAREITFLFGHIYGHFVRGNKRNAFKKDW